MKEIDIDERHDEQRRLEAVARWCEHAALVARRCGDFQAAKRFTENAMDCRLRQR